MGFEWFKNSGASKEDEQERKSLRNIIQSTPVENFDEVNIHINEQHDIIRYQIDEIEGYAAISKENINHREPLDKLKFDLKKSLRELTETLKDFTKSDPTLYDQFTKYQEAAKNLSEFLKIIDETGLDSVDGQKWEAKKGEFEIELIKIQELIKDKKLPHLDN